MKKHLPNFKTTFSAIGITYILLSLGLFSKGLIPSMAEFKVPQQILDSPHYYDAILWVYIHMIVIGLLILLIGNSVTDLKKQLRLSVALFFITCFYTYLDFRSSDSMLGNSLYKGESSIVPAFIGVIVNILFLLNAFRLFREIKNVSAKDK